MKETRKFGIVDVDVRSIPIDQYEAPSFESHFPDSEWLAEELKIAREQSAGRRFRERTDWGWYVEKMQTYLAFLSTARRKSDLDEACLYAVELGFLMAESKIKFEWEADALRGRKLVEAGASTRIADDAERRKIVESIMAERGQGARDAFRVAASRNPLMGSASAFKSSYYKKEDKRGD